MTTISKRIGGPAALTTSPATKYQCPASTVAVIRRIHVSNPSGGALTFTMSIGADSTGTRLYDGYSIPSNSVLDARGPFTLEAGDIIQAFGSGTALVIEIDGTETTVAESSGFLAAANGRYFVDNGTPRFLVGDSGQCLGCQISIADVQSYLDTRVAQGFNTVLFELISRHPDGTGPVNVDGHQPFLLNNSGGAYTGAQGTADFSTPKTAYWDHVDLVFAELASRNMVAVAYPCPWGFADDQGFQSDLRNSANTAAVCNGFGQYLANRYKYFQRVIWLDGSDSDGTTTPRSPDGESMIERALAIATGMRSAGALQLRSGDWFPCSLSTRGPADRPTSFVDQIQAQGAYTYGGTDGNFVTDTLTFQIARQGWNYTPIASTQGNPGAGSAPPALPQYLKETAYDGSSFADGTRSGLRKQQYWAWFAGCTAGVIYGSEPVHHFLGSWASHLADASAGDVTQLASLAASVSWQLLVPSELSGMRLLVTTSNGSQSAGAAYVAAACASDGSCLVAYVPPNGSGAQSFDVDLRSMFGSTTAKWRDPTTGGLTTIGSVNNTDAAHAFTTPGNNVSGANDWILVLQ